MECTHLQKDEQTRQRIMLYVGCHIDTMTEAFRQAQVDKLRVVNCFREILDGLYLVLRQEAPELLHDQNCQCREYIKRHAEWVATLEQELQTYLGRDILVNPQACWIIQMQDKYNLLHQLYVRRM